MRSLDSIRDEYEQLVPKLRSMHDGIRDRVESAFQSSGIPLACPIQTRIKSLDSLLRKLGKGTVRVRKLSRVQDLVGIRVVVLFKRDVQRASDLLKQLFLVRSETDCGADLGEENFGYRSVHLIVDLPPDVQSSPDFAECFGLRAEVQVRTLAQHCWAAASHQLQYKSAESVTASVKRPLLRVAALLELIDLEFERVLELRQQYRDSAFGESDESALNVDNLESILRQKFPHHGWWLDAHGISDILQDLAYFGIDTRGKLNNLLSYHASMLPSNSAESEESAEAHYDEEFDDSPSSTILWMLSLEYPEHFSSYQCMKAAEIFKDFAPDYAQLIEFQTEAETALREEHDMAMKNFYPSEQ